MGRVLETDGEFQGALFSVCGERHLFGLYVYHFGVDLYFIADGDEICFLSCGGFNDRFRRCVLVTGQYRAYQAVRFYRAWRSPA